MVTVNIVTSGCHDGKISGWQQTKNTDCLGCKNLAPHLDPTHSIQTTLYVETWFLKGKWILLVLGFWIITAKGSETIKTLVIIFN